MSEEYQRIEVISVARRRHWSTEAKLRIIEESFEPGETVSSVARRNGVAPNLLVPRRRLLSEGGTAVDSDSTRGRQFGTPASSGAGARTGTPAWPQDHGERDPPGSARQVASKKTDLAAALACEGRFAVKRIAEVLGVSRSNLADRHNRGTRPRGAYRKADDEDLLPLIRRFVDERPTYGYRRITALVNRELARTGRPIVNRKWVHRIMQQAALLLERHTGRRERRVHDGKVMVMRSNLRWCSDGLEFACWNGEIIRMAFIIDAFDREIVAWTAVSRVRHQRLGHP